MKNLFDYANSLDASQEIINWLSSTAKTALKKQLVNENELEHIIDFLASSQSPRRLQKLSIKDAKRLAKDWSERQQKKGAKLIDSSVDISVVHDFLDGTKIVELKTDKAFKREGFLMAHCLGGYTPKENVSIYSYRDKKNHPHATFEVNKKDDQVIQVKGKGNGAIHPKYVHAVITFLQILGIQVRSSEMRNLGYYVIDPAFIPFLHERGLKKRVVTLLNETYVY